MRRRAFLKASGATVAVAVIAPPWTLGELRIPVVDSHIHLFDPTRPGGVPWPEISDATLYRPALPNRYARLAERHGVVGAIAVECSPWMVDNFWLNDVVEQNPMMLGYVGDLLPDTNDFGATLDRLHRSPFFLGIRYGNLWNRDLGAAVHKPTFVRGLELLAQAGLVLETANPNGELIAAVVQVSDRVPDLRIVLDHLPNAALPTIPQKRGEYDAHLRELATRPQVFVKGSEIIRRINGGVPLNLSAYKDALDQIWDLFGDNRIFFGSDWPNSDTVASYDQVFNLAQSYIETRTRSAQQGYFWENSRKVYRWNPRTPGQRSLLSAPVEQSP